MVAHLAPKSAGQSAKKVILIVHTCRHMAVCQNLVPLVNIKIAGKWMFIPLKMVLIGIDPYPYKYNIMKNLWRSWMAGEFAINFSA